MAAMSKDENVPDVAEPLVSEQLSTPTVGSSSSPSEKKQNALEVPNGMVLKRSPACPECKKKKQKCVHREEWLEDLKKKGKGGGFQGKITKNTVLVENTMGTLKKAAKEQAKLPESPSGRPHRQGAGKRKFEETFDEIAPPIASQRPKKKSSNFNETQEGKQRKKPGPKPRQNPGSVSIVIPDIPDTPEPSPSVVEEPTQEQQTFGLCNGDLFVSIDMAWHQHMTKTLEKKINNTREKWLHMTQTMERVQGEWEEVLQSMHSTTQFMHEWSKRFLRQNDRIQ